ncbi:hypothetical protein SAMN05661008_00945 [Alkalithermobacter thermoalcaliphilus JW-YL-7 = DSM 7308]|uniref:Uncharacterized protein n=1 Tax=Alkalithermobacter thermoalcaliphilus JW-YL-7 = DSM 7308 TaxID=1121328 RepID=A0A150FQF3_CLOPD|nr:hypothetical protein JWYL7_0909 [[Clostridium] paradoxum JW-YL-7 = DSM 7308]SHK80966.1 hypothetical protein SAMN05661008_00945 [[Clostridium] paradoxum JW-YL-7 = DSM 7308]
MLNGVVEIRERKNNNLYNLTLEIPDKRYFEVYEDINEENALDIVNRYLISKQDDARPQNIKIKYDQNSHLIRLTTDLYYLGNDHTDYN